MSCNHTLTLVVRMLLGALLSSAPGVAQTGGAKPAPGQPSLPVSIEWGESFNPRAQSKLATNSFRFGVNTKTLKMQYSTQAPAFLGGKQFQWMPGGYQVADFSVARKWGAIHGFRSLRFNSAAVRRDLARTITGAGMEIPKSPLGARVSAYFLHASPMEEARAAKTVSLIGSKGTQFGVALVRDFNKQARLQAELSESRHEARPMPAKESPGPFGGARRALMLGFEGTAARTEFSSTFISRGEGMANPAAPSYAPGKQNARLNARRKFKDHQFQYSAQSDAQKAVPFLGIVVRGIREQSLSWSYVRKRMPQVSASVSSSRQTVAGRSEVERGMRLSLAKSVRRISATLGFANAQRTDLQSMRPQWRRNVLSADTGLEIGKGKRLHIRYEASSMVQDALAQKLMVSSLQMDTRVLLWKEKVSLTPTLDVRRQAGTIPAQRQTSARMALSALLKLPRWIPGTDLLLNFASNHVRSAGRPDWNRMDLTMHWNFKRF